MNRSKFIVNLNGHSYIKVASANKRVYRSFKYAFIIMLAVFAMSCNRHTREQATRDTTPFVLVSQEDKPNESCVSYLLTVEDIEFMEYSKDVKSKEFMTLEVGGDLYYANYEVAERMYDNLANSKMIKVYANLDGQIIMTSKFIYK